MYSKQTYACVDFLQLLFQVTFASMYQYSENAFILCVTSVDLTVDKKLEKFRATVLFISERSVAICYMSK